MLPLEQNPGPAGLKNRAGFQLGREKRRVMRCDLSTSVCEEEERRGRKKKMISNPRFY